MTPRIFSPDPLRADSRIALSGSAMLHVGKVLRLRPGDAVVLFDGAGLEYAALIESITRHAVTVSVGGGRDPGTESDISVTLLQGICRSQRMDLLVQKSTELGVAAIRPVACERSVVRLDGQRGTKKVEHWRQVAIAACEQSGRSRIPEIAPPLALTEAVDDIAVAVDACLLLDRQHGSPLVEAVGRGDRLAVLTGPEGGLTEAERAMARRRGFVPVRLGPRTLRTETAPLAALSIIQYLAGDLR